MCLTICEKMVKIGVLGAGNHSVTQHGPALKIYKDKFPHIIKLSAVCDLDINKAKSYAKQFGFLNYYTNIEEMLQGEDLDGLILVTPIFSTKRIVESVMGKGIALMIEKPPGESSAQALELLHIANKTNTPHVVSFDRRFSPVILKAKEWIEKKLPERAPISVFGKMLRNNRKEPNFAFGTGIHLVDAVLSFAGRPLHTHSIKVPTAESYSYIATISCNSGVSASVIISPLCGATEEVYEVYGTGYYINIDLLRGRLVIFEKGLCILDWSLPLDANPAYKSGCVGEVENFINYLTKNNIELFPDLTDGYYSMLVAEAIMEGGSKQIGSKLNNKH